MSRERSPVRPPSRTKIVATVGPACEGPGILHDLLRAGVDLFRINSAHGEPEEHRGWVHRIREASRATGIPVAILVDLAGPKIRLGELPGGTAELAEGSTVRIVRPGPGLPGELSTTWPSLPEELSPGDRVVLADGTVSLSVLRREPGGAVCRVVQGGTVRSRQGVNLPGAKLSVPAATPADRETARRAVRQGVDFLGVSFLRTPEELSPLREILASEGSEAQLVAKIEKPEALANLDGIVAAADGVMVARGDLGVEIDIAEVPVAQKRILAACHAARLPSIVATQMLESMLRARIPTRAEATDVANAILDGADALLLSGETAVGDHPVEAVETMHRIALAAEQMLAPPPGAGGAACPKPVSEITLATVRAAGRMAQELGAKTILVATATGRSALCLSKLRIPVRTVAAAASETVLRRLCLYWGVVPLPGVPADDPDELLRIVTERGKDSGALLPGDRILLLSGTGLPASRHNRIAVHEVE